MRLSAVHTDGGGSRTARIEGDHLTELSFADAGDLLQLEGWHSKAAQAENEVGELPASEGYYATLRPGDLVHTGTPGGVGAGQEPLRFQAPGDEVRTTISGLGEMCNRCAVEEGTIPSEFGELQVGGKR